MLVECQDEVISWLGDAATHGGHPVERIETHSAIVFLAGGRALKLKRAVRYDYLDFSSVDRRRAACEAELRLNRRLAPSIYRGVEPVVRRQDGSLALGLPGEPVDWVVDMARFNQDDLLDRLVDRGALPPDLMRELARAVAAAHREAAPCPGHGGAAAMAWVIDGNAQGFAEEGKDILPAAAAAEVTRQAHRSLARLADLLDRRQREGRVRWCHGDLHLRNLVLLEGRPTLFDAVEFNERIACGDVLYDLAFLVMDLWRRTLHLHANLVFNEYLAATGEHPGVAAMPLFLSCRAAVRAKTSATAARLQAEPARSGALQAQARTYLDLAQQFLEPPPARLIACGGYSGSGKSSVAAAVAPFVGAAPGAVVLRSDVVRKALAGKAPEARLPAEAYTDARGTAVYDSLIDAAVELVRGGHSALVDAAFLNPSRRAALEERARSEGLAFTGLWLEAPPATLRARVEARTGDASDATVAVLDTQLRQGHGTIGWQVVDAGDELPVVAARAARILGVTPPPAA